MASSRNRWRGVVRITSSTAGSLIPWSTSRCIKRSRVRWEVMPMPLRSTLFTTDTTLSIPLFVLHELRQQCRGITASTQGEVQLQSAIITKLPAKVIRQHARRAPGQVQRRLSPETHRYRDICQTSPAVAAPVIAPDAAAPTEASRDEYHRGRSRRISSFTASQVKKLRVPCSMQTSPASTTFQFPSPPAAPASD